MKNKNLLNISALKKAVGKDVLCYTEVDNCVVFWTNYFAGKVSKAFFEEVNGKISCENKSEMPTCVKEYLFDYNVDDLYPVHKTRFMCEVKDGIGNFYVSKNKNRLIVINNKYIDILPDDKINVLRVVNSKYSGVYCHSDFFEFVIMPIMFNDNNAIEEIKFISELL